MKKSAFVLLLAMTVIFGLTACGGDNKDSPAANRCYAYFEEMPQIPTPDSAFDLEVHPLQVKNGKAYYLSHTDGPNPTQTVMLNYLTLLSECGFLVQPSDKGYVVSLDGQDCMTVQLNDGVIKVIFPDPDTEGSGVETIEMPSPVVLVDNQYCCIELLRFRKVTGSGDHPIEPNHWVRQDSGITFHVDLQFTNKSAFEYKVQSELYLDDESVLDLTKIGGTSTSPAPGKKGIMEITIARWDGTKELPITMDDLYSLNGSFAFFSGLPQGVSFDFSVEEALGR